MAQVRPHLSPYSRLLLVQRTQDRPVAHVAAELGVSRQTAYRWVRRYASEGAAGLLDRSSRPRIQPHRTSPTGPAQPAKPRSSRCGPRPGGGRSGWPPSSGPARPPSGGSCAAIRSRSCATWTRSPAPGCAPAGPPAAATSATSPASWSTSMSRSWAASPTVVAGGCTAAASRSAGGASATTSSMSPWMITPGWPTPRSWPTSAG